jgi:hypothetical protein
MSSSADTRRRQRFFQLVDPDTGFWDLSCVIKPSRFVSLCLHPLAVMQPTQGKSISYQKLGQFVARRALGYVAASRSSN